MNMNEAVAVLIELANEHLCNARDLEPEYRTLVLEAINVARAAPKRRCCIGDIY